MNGYKEVNEDEFLEYVALNDMKDLNCSPFEGTYRYGYKHPTLKTEPDDVKAVIITYNRKHWWSKRRKYFIKETHL